jgi:hypothetical protein
MLSETEAMGGGRASADPPPRVYCHCTYCAVYFLCDGPEHAPWPMVPFGSAWSKPERKTSLAREGSSRCFSGGEGKDEHA